MFLVFCFFSPPECTPHLQTLNKKGFKKEKKIQNMRKLVKAKLLLNHSDTPLKNKSVCTSGSCMRPIFLISISACVKYGVFQLIAAPLLMP